MKLETMTKFEKGLQIALPVISGGLIAAGEASGKYYLDIIGGVSGIGIIVAASHLYDKIQAGIYELLQD